MDADISRTVHIEIANIFFNQEQDDSDEISSEHNSAGKWMCDNSFECKHFFILSLCMYTYTLYTQPHTQFNNIVKYFMYFWLWLLGIVTYLNDFDGIFPCSLFLFSSWNFFKAL